MVEKGIIETVQLRLHSIGFGLHIHWRHTCMLKGNPAFKRLLDKESLSHAPSSIYGDKLGTVTVLVALQLVNLLFSTNNITHNCL